MGHTTGHRPALPTEEEVGAYLKAHPDFLARHAELVHHLILPPADRGEGSNVVDLQSFMLDRLRREVRTLKDQQRDLIATARANMNSQNRIHAAVLSLLDAPSFPLFVQTITTDLAMMLGVDVASLVIESNGPAPSNSGVIAALPGTVARLLGGRDVMLLSNTPGTADVFGPGAGLVRSQALIRLQVSADSPPGLLAFGARDPVLFHESQATELVGFLARVVERCLRAWLDLPDDE